MVKVSEQGRSSLPSCLVNSRDVNPSLNVPTGNCLVTLPLVPGVCSVLSGVCVVVHTVPSNIHTVYVWPLIQSVVTSLTNIYPHLINILLSSVTVQTMDS